MSAEEEERLQSSNKRRICDKLFNVGDNKVRGHCNVTGNIEARFIRVVILILN